ncbi:DUF1572 domain-containing protein [Aureitalea marina]|uniref:DUF1572 domain-containing protein n=1 Tax=Aureitalea marina TaxID=930804 RepID=A0A2S7KLQ8_9FLAO|nr:DUF1572 domain-containing protein [Aureitalea marina]PQB03542.1 DUF1572 domain-containing protein [Aureitalea marina]
MSLSNDLARHFRGLHFGPSYVGSNLKDALEGVDFREANTRVGSLNTLAMLTFHVNYYVSAVLKVFQGGKLDAHDKFSYDCPPVNSEEDWQQLQQKVFAEAETLADIIDALPAEQLEGPFDTGKYGNNFRNINGLIEHTYYHLGQINIIKRMIREG